MDIINNSSNVIVNRGWVSKALLDENESKYIIREEKNVKINIIVSKGEKVFNIISIFNTTSKSIIESKICRG